MKCSITKRIMSILPALVLLIGMLPTFTLTAFAGHRCPNCDDWIDGSPYCEYCYECAECCEFCYECGICSDCSGWDICKNNCGENGDICVDCALDQGRHCPDCYECYLDNRTWCDECGRCSNCVENCYDCSILGKGIICVECASDEGTHCPDCGGCYGPVLWCQVCLLCENCATLCLGCSEETGEYICADCAIDDGMHCPDCQECYNESNWEYCSDCGICANCIEYCNEHELCINCAVENGYHCPSCEGCCEDEPICEGCGDACKECTDDFCESCGLCSNCVQVCPSCGACSECAEICPNCGEYCSDCEDICDDCEFCLLCCADIASFEGCDCPDRVCVKSDDWQEHFNENHVITAEDAHNARPAKSWSWDENRHWQVCVYCENSEHHSNKFAHTYDKNGMCTVCCYAKGSNIQILKQPEDVKHVNVRSPYESYDNSNIAHFSVKAVGKSELTYTWYTRRYTAPGQWDYVPLKDPEHGEKYTGPDLYIIAATDSCYTTRYYMCIIVDEEGNQARTVEVSLQAQHHYQYFKEWKGDYPDEPYETAARAANYHNLQCVGEGCEKTVSIRPHEDENKDDECDICRREMPAILITEQPKADKNVMVSSSDEDYLENNYAKYSVKAVGSSELTYTWCRRVYTAPGVFHYEPLTNPRDGEVFDKPDARILAPEDACTNTYVYRCIITDAKGNTAETIDVVMEARHNYQYYKYYKSQTGKFAEASRGEFYHIGVCVGNDCGKVSRMSNHIDTDRDFQCEICYYVNFIDEFRLNYVQPVSGNKPDYNMSVDISACYIRGNGTDLTYRRWYESENGVDGWRLMSPDDTFIGGKYYKMEVDVATISGREFSVYNASSYTVWLWTYDKQGQLKQTDSLPLKNYATLTLKTPCYCQPKQITDIVIENLATPVTGQKPDYDITISGSGYKTDTGATSTRKNGIMWKQYGKSDGMNTESKFTAANTYTCFITLVAEDNYAFDAGAVATINGKTATCELYNNNKTAIISYEYVQIPPAYIKEVNITGVQNPWEGDEVNWYSELDSDLYYVDEFGWGDLTEDEAHFGEFKAGHQYEFGIMLVTEIIGGNFQCEFDENVVVTVNGRPATVIDVGWSGYSGSYVYFTCLCPPTGENVKLTTQPESVTVNKGEKATVKISATGTDLTYKWYYKDKNSSKFTITNSFTGPVYSVDMNDNRDGRQIYCEITDGKGNKVVTNTATISMSHQHIYDQKVVKDTYKVSSATCSKKAVYYKSCTCGAAGTATFESGSLPAHTYTNDCDTTCNKCSAKRTITHNYSAATCTAPKTCKVCKATTGKANGHKYTNNCDTSCNVCKTTRKITHSYKEVITKATLTKNGKIENKCSVCGNVSKTTTVNYPKTFTLSATSYTYDGKIKTPTVTVKDAKGKTLKSGTDYTVKYADGRKNAGEYKVTITMKGNYSGTKTLTFNILPGKTSKITATPATTTLKATWSKVTGATGYKVELLNASGKVVKSATTTSLNYTFSKLTAGTNYKVRVTAYKTISGKNQYSLVSTTLATATNPATPTLTLSSTTKGKANLKWTNVAGENGYQVYYSTSENGTYSKLGTYSADTTSGSKSSLTSGKTYYFKVRAYKKVGDTVYYGGWSTVKSVKIK